MSPRGPWLDEAQLVSVMAYVTRSSQFKVPFGLKLDELVAPFGIEARNQLNHSSNLNNP